MLLKWVFDVLLSYSLLLLIILLILNLLMLQKVKLYIFFYFSKKKLIIIMQIIIADVNQNQEYLKNASFCIQNKFEPYCHLKHTIMWRKVALPDSTCQTAISDFQDYLNINIAKLEIANGLKKCGCISCHLDQRDIASWQ